MNENLLRLAIARAEKLDNRLDEVRVCPECGNSIRFRENFFNKTNMRDSVYCTCEPYGPPMLRIDDLSRIKVPAYDC